MNKVEATIATAILAVFFYSQYNVYANGRDSEDFEAVCVKNQTVMVAEFGVKMSAYNALNPNGKPISCNGEYKSESSWNPFSIDGDDWESMCFSGQRVFQANYFAKQATVIALTPDGKPKSCVN